MKVYINENTNPPTLFIVATNQKEHLKFVDFCRLETPLVVAMKHDAAFMFRHIEIRKERS